MNVTRINYKLELACKGYVGAPIVRWNAWTVTTNIEAVDAGETVRASIFFQNL